MIYGFVGAGKTTFAKKLEQETSAVRFSPDEWMIERYGTNPPVEKFQDYYNEIDALIWKEVEKTVARGGDVILDFGFWDRASRDYARAFAAKHHAEVKLYALTCPEDIMRQRVLERTRSLPPGALVIDENAFELFKTRFEELEDDEGRVVVDTAPQD